MRLQDRVFKRKNGFALRQHDNSFFGDPILFQQASSLSAPILPELADLGAYAASDEAENRARLIMRHRPLLHLYDSSGARCEEVDLHPAYHSLLTRARHAGIASSLFEAEAVEIPVRHQARAIRLFLLSEIECITSQELCLSSAALALLHQDENLIAEWKPLLISRTHDPLPDPYPKKQGASLGIAWQDCEASQPSQALGIQAAGQSSPAVVRIHGRKAKVINPLADGFLVQALFEGQQCLFLVPRLLADGRLNNISLFPTLLSSPTSCADLTFSASAGWRLGGVGEAENLLRHAQTAIQCDINVMRVGQMRRALRLAIDKLRHDKELEKNKVQSAICLRILADAALDCAAATLLVLRVARAFDCRYGEAQEAILAQLAQPLVSYWLTLITPQILDCAQQCQMGQVLLLSQGEGNFYDRTRHSLLMDCIFGKTTMMHLFDALLVLNRHEENIKPLVADLVAQSGIVGEKNGGVLQAAAQMASEDPSVACLFAEQFVYTLAAASLRQLDMEIVTSAFMNSRLGGQWRSSYGSLSLRFNPTFILETLYPSS